MRKIWWIDLNLIFGIWLGIWAGNVPGTDHSSFVGTADCKSTTSLGTADHLY